MNFFARVTTLPSDCLKTLYYSLVHSHFTYGIIAWGNSNLKSLVPLQKRVIRVIYNAPYNGSTDPRFNSSGILKISYLFVYQSLIFHVRLPFEQTHTIIQWNIHHELGQVKWPHNEIVHIILYSSVSFSFCA